MDILNSFLDKIDYSEDYDTDLDELTSLEEGEFSFIHEKPKAIFFYAHILSVHYDRVPININLARECLEEDSECFFKLIFFLRDHKYGLGQKKEFRKILKILGEEYPEEFNKYISYIPIYGRYDDLYELFYSKNEETVIDLFKSRLEEDLESDNPSNLAKWLKSINASSKETRKLAKRTAELMGLSLTDYRKTLSKLRKKLNVLETLITTNNFKQIKYGELSNKNLIKYKSLFLSKDKERFEEFLNLSNNTIINTQIDSEIYFEKYKYLNLLDTIQSEKLNFQSIKEEIYLKYNLNSKNDWLPVTLFKEEDIKNKNTYFSQSMLLTLTYLSFNSNTFKNYYMKSIDTPALKKISNFENNINLLIDEITSNSISEKISLQNLFDLLLLLKVKNSANEDFILPEGVILTLHDYSELVEIDDTNKCSVHEKIAFSYTKLKEKWEKFNFNIPKLKIWLIEENYLPQIFSLANGNVTLIKGSGEKVFENIIKNKYLTDPEKLTYEELIDELANLMEDERYKL